MKLGRALFCSLIFVALFTYFSFFGFSGAGGPSTAQYALVIDAGSSGSRLHLYEFDIAKLFQRTLSIHGLMGCLTLLLGKKLLQLTL